MATKPRKRSCSGCGAELRPGPATCPLCGTDANQQKTWGAQPAPKTDSVGDYQADMRKLREQLRRLREGDAEAS